MRYLLVVALVVPALGCTHDGLPGGDATPDLAPGLLTDFASFALDAATVHDAAASPSDGLAGDDAAADFAFPPSADLVSVPKADLTSISSPDLAPIALDAAALHVDGSSFPSDLTAAGNLRIQVLDDNTHLPIAAKAIITAVAPTSPVHFDIDSNTGMQVPGGVGQSIAPGVIGAADGVYLVHGDGTFQAPSGTYQLFITHGPEWETSQSTVTLSSTLQQVTASLRHSVDTHGWLAADLDIHTRRSYDSKLDPAVCAISEVAAGVEVLVATDHNVLTNLQPTINSLGYGQIARAVVGDETNFEEGQAGAYPMPYDPNDPMSDGGAAEWMLDFTHVSKVTAGILFDRIHALSTQPVIAINHPRRSSGSGYFSNLAWAPPMPLPTASKFDSLELMNGYENAPANLAVVVRDWFFFLSTGHPITAVGGSDSRNLTGARAGYPRVWLRTAGDDPTRFTDANLGDAIRRHRGIVSNGPFAVLTVDNVAIGDLDTNTTGKVNLQLIVDAPDWIGIDRAAVYVNSKKALELPIPSGQRPRLNRQVPLTIPPGDAWVVLITSGSQALPPGVVAGTAGTIMPFAITNPVFIDGNGDQQWTPQIANPDPGPLPSPP